MLFNSFSFIGLVLITSLLYYSARFSKYQLQILVIASLVFYATRHPAMLLVLLVSATINILCSYYVYFIQPQYKKLIATLGVLMNLGLLGFFKYSPLFSSTFLDENSRIGELLLGVPLPIGISFYTFQGISLLVDVFKSESAVSDKLVNPSLLQHSTRTLFFISFFPHSVAGPIVKAHSFLPQISVKSKKDINWEHCFRYLVTGYFLKMVVADNLVDYTYWLAYPYFLEFSSINLLVFLIGYSVQIFADFAGYSSIALGLAALFGYKLINNFNFPYISTSFSEFWSRWHISLSSFLKEYLYIPLGGNRKGELRTCFNLMTTMALGGLWHGATWTFAVWGFSHGLLLVIERIMKKITRMPQNLLVSIASGVFVFFMVSVGWLHFKLNELNHIFVYLQQLFPSNSNPMNKAIIVNILLYSSPVLIFHLLYLAQKHIEFKVTRLEPFVYAIMIFLIVTNAGNPNSFIYFQF